MLQRERLRDKSAHRPSQYACALETERLDYMRGIVCELGDVEWLSVVARAADPAVIEQDELVGRPEPINERRIPVGARRGEAVQDQKRSAFPNSAITNLRALDRDRRVPATATPIRGGP